MAKALKDIIRELQDSGKFKTTNSQDFYSAPYDRPFNFGNYKCFKIGTMHGLWKYTKNGFEILALLNDKIGNGHFEDCLDWFYASCTQAQVPLIIKQVDNKRLLKHLIKKRGFKQIEGTEDCVKNLAAIEKDVALKVKNKTYLK